jgi:hypothetical protein
MEEVLSYSFAFTGPGASRENRGLGLWAFFYLIHADPLIFWSEKRVR